MNGWMKRLAGAMGMGLGMGLALVAGTASAQGYPTQPVRWIVPYAAGGGTDNLARTLGEAMQASLGQSIVIENRPGASTNIGVAALLQSKPDGYTIMQAENAALLFNEHLFAKLPYKPDTDFTYIGAIGRFPVALVVHPSFPAKTVAEYVAYVKANPDKVSYGSPGNGSPHHMAMELLKQRAGIQMQHVPYKGAAPALQDLLAGQIPTMMLDLPGGLQAMKAGTVRVLAVANPKRVPSLPDVPTFVESGFADVNAAAFHGLIGPAGLPAEVVSRLNGELHKAMQAPKVVRLFGDFGMEPLPGTPADFRSMSRAEAGRWGSVIRATGVKLD